jgi:hypothetical protein
MGNVATTTPRVVLQEDVQLHFKAATVKEVEEVVHNWFEEGATLGLSEEIFQKTLCLHSNASKFFQCFDTDHNKKVDAFEVLAALIILSNGTIPQKIDTIFPVFDFSSSGFLNFDEMNILVHSTYRGLHKLVNTPAPKDPETRILEIGDKELSDVCSQMFDSHNLPYDQSISKEQFKRWLKNDIEATKFVDAFHCGYSLPDVEAVLAKKEERQAAVFYHLLQGKVGGCVPVVELLYSEALKQSLDDPPAEIFENLVKLMATSSSGFQQASHERFAEVNHAWNVYNVVDNLKEGTLDPKELQPLMWLQHRAKPSPADIQKELESLAIHPDGMISRTAWITANVGVA